MNLPGDSLPAPREPSPGAMVQAVDYGMAEPLDQAPAPRRSEVLGERQFEDFFPALDLTEDEKEKIVTWLTDDLKKCVRYVEGMRDKWSVYRAIFMLDYVEKFFPGIFDSLDTPAGLLCDKVLEAMNRLRKAVRTPRPLFVVDSDTARVQAPEYIHRMEWFMHSLLTRDMKVWRLFGPQVFFDFVLDGSAIIEADQMYEKVPMRVLKSYSPDQMDELIADGANALDQAQFDEAALALQQGENARMLVEEELMTKEGLQAFYVDKADHLIPPNVHSDEDLEFRGRRMFLTRGDLELLSRSGVDWYKREDVDKVLDFRQGLRLARWAVGTGKDEKGFNAQQLAETDRTNDLSYGWGNTERLEADPGELPYNETWAIYRVTAKYGYTTRRDPHGSIPKYCVFDLEPESKTLLRAVTYPHFEDRPNFFHFKLGYAPKSYYGFGFGARLVKDDKLESNIISLFTGGSAIATFRPFITVSPEFDGVVPFIDGLGPAKVGYVRNVADFKPFELPPPPESLMRHIVPLIRSRAETRTGVTSLVQGRTESTDPRSPAQKTSMLLNQAFVSIESIIEDWNLTGWEPFAQFVWLAAHEKLVFEGEDVFNGKIEFPGLAPDLERNGEITEKDLKKDLVWKSQAASTFLNAELRRTEFLRTFQFFMPLIQQLATVNANLYRTYFVRWLNWAAQELELRGRAILVPTPEQLQGIPIGGLQNMMQNTMDALRSGPSMQNLTQGKGGAE